MHGVHRPSWYSLRFFNIFHIFLQYRQTLLVFSPLLKDFSSISIYTNPLGNLSFVKIFQLEYEIDPRVNQPGRFQERVEEWRMRSMQRKVQSK